MELETADSMVAIDDCHTWERPLLGSVWALAVRNRTNGHRGAGGMEVCNRTFARQVPLQGRGHEMITCKYRRYARCADEGAPLAALAT